MRAVPGGRLRPHTGSEPDLSFTIAADDRLSDQQSVPWVTVDLGNQERKQFLDVRFLRAPVFRSSSYYLKLPTLLE